MPDLVFAKSSFAAEHEGRKVHVRKGDPFEADHPLVRRYPESFDIEPPKLNAEKVRPVEDATAAPGRKRRTK